MKVKEIIRSDNLIWNKIWCEILGDCYSKSLAIDFDSLKPRFFRAFPKLENLEVYNSANKLIGKLNENLHYRS